MNEKTINYAMNNLKTISDDCDVSFHRKIDNVGIYVEFPNGRNLSLSEDEIYYQAQEHLEYEIEGLKHT